MELTETLEKINSSISRYETCKLSFTADQSEILRDLSTSLYRLSEIKVKVHEEWMSFYFQSKGKSEAAKEREADHKCPEMYQVRQLLASGGKVLESLRSTLSANKG